MKKRIVIMSDMHCGSKFGLTPPRWQTCKDERVSKLQQDQWNWYKRNIRQFDPIDIVIHNGDAIDGDGKKNGGIELMTTDRNEQVEMAFHAILEAGSTKDTKYEIILGTPYHCGEQEDFERNLASKLDTEATPKGRYSINGLILDVRHFVSGGNLPHTKGNGVIKESLFDIWQAAYYESDVADIIVRSHVHKSFFASGFGKPNQVVFITPSMQMPYADYAQRKCSGVIDIGFLVLDIDEKGKLTWTMKTMDLRSKVAQAKKL